MSAETPKLMRWWRVELGKDGAIKSCDEVEQTSKQGRHVRFVEAPTKADACSFAKRWVENHKKVEHERNLRRAKEAKEKGLCSRCRVNKAAAGISTCGPCLKKRNSPRVRPPAFKGSPEEVMEHKLGLRRERNKERRKFVAKVIGANVDPSVIAVIKRLFDELGPERFRAKLCEVVPDGPEQRAEAAE